MFATLLFLLLAYSSNAALIAHFPLRADFTDIIGSSPTTNFGVAFTGGFATFAGSQYFTINTPNALTAKITNDLSVSVWVKVTQWSTGIQLFNIFDGGNFEWRYEFRPTSIEWTPRIFADFDADYNFPLNTWIHIGMAYTLADTHYWINGVAVPITHSPAFGDLLPVPTLFVGDGLSGAVEHSVGNMLNLKFYDTLETFLGGCYALGDPLACDFPCDANNNQRCNGDTHAICTNAGLGQRTCTCPNGFLGTTTLTGFAAFTGCGAPLPVGLGCGPVGSMSCITGLSNGYTTCAAYTGTPVWGPVQLCQAGLSCQATGNVIYCVTNPPTNPLPVPVGQPCTAGTMTCIPSMPSSFAACAAYTGSNLFGPVQTCPAGEVCQQNGNVIYCVPGASPPLIGQACPTSGFMSCLVGIPTHYTTCADYGLGLKWGVMQNCQAGLHCQQQGTVIYCVS